MGDSNFKSEKMIMVIDSGTTNTKVFYFKENGEIFDSSFSKTGIYTPKPGFVQQKAERWFKAIVEAKRKMKKAEIEKIVITTQGATFVPLDKNLKPLTDAFTWLDNRAVEIAKNLKEKYGDDFFYKKTGLCIDSWLPISIILYLKEKNPEIYKNIKRISFISDYLNFKLTGEFFIDKTNAQMSSFYNIVKDRWDEQICEIAGINKSMLPEIVPSGETGGKLKREIAKLLEIKEGIPVISGGHDQYCACYGAGVREKGDCLLSTGTAFALLVLTDNLFFCPERKWRPGRYLFENKYGLMGPIANGCVVFDWIIKNFKKFKIKKIKDTKVEFIPYFSEGKGEIKNLSLSTKPEEIYYSAVRGIVYEIKKFLNIIEDKIEVERFFLTGGGTRIEFLPQLIKEITGKEVIIPEIKECAAKGAFLLARYK